MAKKKARIGSDPLAWIKSSARAESQQGKLSKQRLQRKQTNRQTYHLERDLVKKIKDYAYWKRLKISEVVNQALREFFKGKKFTK